MTSVSIAFVLIGAKTCRTSSNIASRCLPKTAGEEVENVRIRLAKSSALM